MAQVSLQSSFYKSISLILLLQVWAFSISGQNSREMGFPYIRNYSPKDYSGDTQNWDILEDDRGIMYFGNNAGVLEFDGAKWRLIQIKNKTVVRGLAKDKQGRIYVGAVGELGYLKPDQKGVLQYVSLVGNLPPDERNFLDVWHVDQLEDQIFFRI